MRGILTISLRTQREGIYQVVYFYAFDAIDSCGDTGYKALSRYYIIIMCNLFPSNYPHRLSLD